MSATTSASSRISTRLDEKRVHKLEFLKKTTHLGTSEIVKRGIDLVYEQTREARPDSFALMQESGFIGAWEGEPDLSTRYKKDLTASLEAKHGDR